MLSNKIMRALGEHETLRGLFERNDFLVRALDKVSHNGYQKWHIAYDDEVVEWLSTNAKATDQEFLKFLLEIYSRKDMVEKFPGAVELLQQALKALEDSSQ